MSEKNRVLFESNVQLEVCFFIYMMEKNIILNVIIDMFFILNKIILYENIINKSFNLKKDFQRGKIRN